MRDPKSARQPMTNAVSVAHAAHYHRS